MANPFDQFDTPPKPTAPKKASARPAVRTRKQALRETARRVIAEQRAEPSMIPLPVRDRTAALMGSVNDAFFGLPARIAGGITRTPNDLMQEFARQQGERAPVTNFIGTLAAGMLTGGGLVKGAGTLTKSSIPALARTGNLVQRATTLRRGQKVLNAAKIAGTGAAAGAATAAGKGENVGEGAAYGAGGALAAGGAMKAGGWLYGKASEVLRLSGADAILRRYTKATREQLSQRAQDFRNKTGTEPTVYELLDLEDRENLRGVLRRLTTPQRERAAAKARTRVQNIPGDIARVVDKATAREKSTIASRLATNLAQSRGSKSPTLAEKRMARAAAENPTRLAQLRREEAANIMKPYDERTAYMSVNDLIPAVPVAGKKAGQVVFQTDDPEVSKAILAAAGSMKLRPESQGIKVREITGIIQELKEDLDGSVIERGTAQRAIDHLEGLLAKDHPDVLPAINRMNAAWAARTRQLEGMGSLRPEAANAQVSGAKQLRKAENIYQTPEGAAGRVMGQRMALTEDLGAATQPALGKVRELAESRTVARNLAANIGKPATRTITEAARAQSESARKLASMVRDPTVDLQAIEAGDLALLASAINPASMAYTKARALAVLTNLLRGIPEGRSRVLTDMLFSQDENLTRRAINALRSEGDAGERALAAVFAAGQAAAGAGASSPSSITGTAPLRTSPENQQPAETNPFDQFDTGEEMPAGFEGAASPYAQELQRIYDTEDPAVLDLIGRVEQQESGGDQSAVSPAGAVGVMQVMPDTAPEAATMAGVPWDEEAYRNDPAYNRLLGIAYLTEMLRRYDGDAELALIAYNAGPRRADEYAAGRGELPDETKNYVARILG